MKNALLGVAYFLLISCNFNRDSKLIKEYSTIPSFDITMLDSTTIFNTTKIPTGRPTVIIYFSPDCEHCEDQINGVVKEISSLNGARILLISPASLYDIKKFYISHELYKYKQVTVGRDHRHSVFRIYNVTTFPYTAIYDSQNKLVKSYYGTVELFRITDAVYNL